MDLVATYPNAHLVRSSICTPPILEEQNSPVDGESISCYVTLPDGLVIEVCLPRNSKGIKCLEEICKRLDIVELDYFGLRYEGPKGELLWLNMRNKISKQMRQSRWKTVAKHQSYRCYRLQFRVKFFVPCHMLLQDSTRTQYYLNLRNSFLDGDFVRHAQMGTLSQSDIRGLYALIAQVELGDFDNEEASTMKTLYQSQLGFRPQLNAVTTTAASGALTEEPQGQREGQGEAEGGLHGQGRAPTHDMHVEDELVDDAIETAQEHDEEDAMLDATYEAHRSLKGTKRKTALNRFIEEMCKLDDYGYEFHLVENCQYESVLIGVGPDAITICKLNAALLGQLSCCVSRAGKYDSMRLGRIRRESDSDCGAKPPERTAFLRLGRASRRRLFRRPARGGTQLDSTDVQSEPEPEPVGLEWRSGRVRTNTESWHRSRNDSESSGSEGAGAAGGRRNSESESHSACKLIKVALENGKTERALREVSTHRLAGECLERYAYAVVSRARVDDRVMFLTVANEHGVEREFGSRCVSSKAAISLYRAITERHTFYRCDSIRNDVATQTKRDFRGTIASLFSEAVGTTSCADFVFDIARTSREAFDFAKRTLFRRDRDRANTSRESHVSTSDADVDVNGEANAESRERRSEGAVEGDSDCKSTRPCAAERRHDSLLDELEQLREQLHARNDDRLCRVCMDAPKQVAIEPCGHFCMCLACVAAVHQCPFCRAPIDKTIRIYEPGSS